MVAIINSDDSDDDPEQLQYKVIVLGDGAVGKTSLAMRFTGDYCRKSYKQTIGVDFFLKHMTIPGDLQIGIQLWDIGGQTIGGKMIRNYIFGAQAVLLVYDITNYQSFANLEDWLMIVRDTFGPDHMPYVGLVANKMDLKHMRAVSTRKHHEFADEHSLASFSVSAKTGEGVAPSFLRVAADLAGVVITQKDLEAVSKPSHPAPDASRVHTAGVGDESRAGAGASSSGGGFASPAGLGDSQGRPGASLDGQRQRQQDRAGVPGRGDADSKKAAKSPKCRIM